MKWPEQPITIALATVVAIAALSVPGGLATANTLIAGQDSQALVVDGELVINAGGRRVVSIIDVSDGQNPTVRATLQVPNSIFGPPTNVAIGTAGKWALVAEAVALNEAGTGFEPSDKVHVIDLSGTPKLVNSLTVGKQPSGIAVHPGNRMALVANRAETSLSVLRISPEGVSVEGKVDLPEGATHVAFTPDGRRALITHFEAHKVALLEVAGMQVRHTGIELHVGRYPYNADISPDGRLALVANTGNGGRSDGHADSVTVIDLKADPPRVIDHIGVDDAPEAIAISPNGRLAVTGNLGGSDAPNGAWYHRARGTISVLGIDGARVRLLDTIELGAIPESVAFSPDGKWLYVGNLNDRDVSILSVTGLSVRYTGKDLPLPGNPGSLRSLARGAATAR